MEEGKEMVWTLGMLKFELRKALIAGTPGLKLNPSLTSQLMPQVLLIMIERGLTPYSFAAIENRGYEFAKLLQEKIVSSRVPRFETTKLRYEKAGPFNKWMIVNPPPEGIKLLLVVDTVGMDNLALEAVRFLHARGFQVNNAVAVVAPDMPPETNSGFAKEKCSLIRVFML